MSSLTNERLRYWLSTNQAARERLCASLLPVLGAYSSVRPRRPEGGPDGARDLDAVFQRKLEAAVAIGFRNNVRDDDEDKRWVREKALDDAKSAKLKTRATHFVFITNVDLTPSEITKITSAIYNIGFASCDVIHRERIRLALDSPEGFAARATHLQIPLDVSEQATFFAKYSDRLGGDAARDLQSRLARIELRLEGDRPVSELKLNFAFRSAKNWRALSGGVLQLWSMSWDRSRQVFQREVTFVFRRSRNGLPSGAKWMHARPYLTKYDGERLEHGSICPLISWDNRRVELTVPVASMLPLEEKSCCLRAFDGSAIGIRASGQLVQELQDIELVVDSWVLGEVSAPSHGTNGVRLPWGGTVEGLHRREREAELFSVDHWQIDFRRISPRRIWDESSL